MIKRGGLIENGLNRERGLKERRIDREKSTQAREKGFIERGC